MSSFAHLPDLWSTACSLEEYAAGMTKYREQMLRRLSDVRLSAEQKQAFAPVDQVRYVLATTEDWCGDAVLNLPIVAQIVKALPNAELRVIVRSADERWKDHLFSRNLVYVPVVTILDAEFNELGVWMERPQVATRLFEEWKAARPDYMAIRYSTELSSGARKEQLAPFYAQLIEDMCDWYNGDLNVQQATVDEILAVLAKDTPVG
jgi:hypothetical protein